MDVVYSDHMNQIYDFLHFIISLSQFRQIPISYVRVLKKSLLERGQANLDNYLETRMSHQQKLEYCLQGSENIVTRNLPSRSVIDFDSTFGGQPSFIPLSTTEHRGKMLNNPIAPKNNDQNIVKNIPQ